MRFCCAPVSVAPCSGALSECVLALPPHTAPESVSSDHAGTSGVKSTRDFRVFFARELSRDGQACANRLYLNYNNIQTQQDN